MRSAVALLVVLVCCTGYRSEPYLEVTYGRLDSQGASGTATSTANLDGWTVTAGQHWRAPTVMSETDREIARRGGVGAQPDRGKDERVRALEDELRKSEARASALQAQLDAARQTSRERLADLTSARKTIGDRDAEIGRLKIDLEKAKSWSRILDVDWSDPGTLLALLIIVTGLVLIIRKTGLPAFMKRAPAKDDKAKS